MSRDQESQDVYKEIDENLRQAYEGLVNEELPERFKSLLQQLKSNSVAISSGEDTENGDVE